MARNTSRRTSPDVVIAGGGVIGLAIAWQSAARGLTVVVADPHPARGASWGAAGMLAPVTEVHYGEERLLELNLESHARYPAWAEELNEASGRDCGYAETGTLVVARDADDNTALNELFDFQQRLGLEVERLRGRECRQLEPALAPSTRGGILVRGDHQIDNRSLLAALLTACERAGVHTVDKRVARVDVADGRVVGIGLDDGERVSCPTVVIAAGAHSAGIGGVPSEVVPPVRPVKGQLLHLRGTPEERLVPRTIRGLDAYIVVRPDGRVVLGATVEEQGFDERVTAGSIHELLQAGFDLVPGITELELVETSVGLRPGSPDNAPMLGQTSVEGLVLATGHYRNGILLTPVTGWAIAELLLTGEEPGIISPYSPRRFSNRSVATGAGR